MAHGNRVLVPVIGLLALAILATCCPAVATTTASEPRPVIGSVLHHVNDVRRHHGRRPLEANGALLRAADAYAKVLIGTGTFSHTGPNGSKFWERASQAGYAGQPCGEN